ncbi:hypothetical protein sp82g_189 [Bacillus phage SP82G]|nr:hypothetical protein sp82g_189 [Bacillus phage SP82G]
MNAQEWLDEIPEDLTETVLDLPPKTIKKLIGLNNSQLRAGPNTRGTCTD